MPGAVELPPTASKSIHPSLSKSAQVAELPFELAEDIISGYSLDTNGNGIPDSCECLADFDNDGQVDVHDILALISTWEYVSTPENPLETDLNGDGIVNIHDLLILIEQYGTC